MKYSNRLIQEKSPYLLQHAHNPVDWYPWGEKAFEKARREDKPIFLSIGYSTCHWCHVMEDESFSDPEVGRLMNEVFVSVKVDREERPDIDHTFMAVCHMMNERCGWPLTILLTPEKEPFFAASYLPKEGRFGLLGVMNLANRVRDWRKTERDKLKATGTQVAEELRKPRNRAAGAEPGRADLDAVFNDLARRFDNENGGFGTAPKFPVPQDILFLLRYAKRTGNDAALRMAERTLDSMRSGGIFDQIGYGFHRYATDAEWLVPHFEKMLYDQAMLTIAYTEAWQATRKNEYRNTAMQILTYVLRDMRAPEGGFYSAEDADSEGEEGGFYLWTAEEIDQIPGTEADLFKKVFGVIKNGNFAEQRARSRRNTGKHVLHRTTTAGAGDGLEDRLEAARQKLFAEREKRVRPHRDDKILTDWNGLMIAALAKAAQAFDRPDYADAAGQAADFILSHMRQNRRLLHRFRDGQAAIPAFADDHAFLIWGLLELYEAAFGVRYFESALELNRMFIEHFWDEDRGGFFFTADGSEVLFRRSKEIYDAPIPSSNSVALLNLLRLGRMTADPDLEQKAARLARAFSGIIRQNPAGHAFFMAAVDFAIGPSLEVVIAGTAASADTAEMLKSLRTRYLPNKVVLLRPPDPVKEMRADITRIAPFIRDHASIGGKTTAYICSRYQCRRPVTDYEMLDRELKAA